MDHDQHFNGERKRGEVKSLKKDVDYDTHLISQMYLSSKTLSHGQSWREKRNTT